MLSAMSDRGPLIAVLDDEPEMRKALRRLLTVRNFAVEEYASGWELLAALDSNPPDCLLLDLHMPELSGLGVIEAFRANRVDLPVIVVTAHDEPATAEALREIGIAGYLRKPVERDKLLSVIHAALAAPRHELAPPAAGYSTGSHFLNTHNALSNKNHN